ncbi:MAG: class I tRNA ligase family protein, partial [Alcaligenaceae bacterium]|nr:class I tRNA ligase family protein [Alcaligenaceae bacterium]
VEKHVHQVGHSERTDAIIEPYLSLQWFVKMEPLAKEVLKFQEDNAITFFPDRFSNTFDRWLENIEDWTISRQLWWGHRIPAWFHNETGEVYVGIEAPEDVENYTQDSDVLDTWFSSALWPFSTMGWPEETEDFKRYYPTNVMVTGYDIIFFWVARMAFQARYFTKDVPFKDVLIHGLIRDEKGRKMSKSLGNGVDPMDVIEDYGVDALRFFLTTNSTPGQDMRYVPEKVESSWNFINKIWNASRFVFMHLEGVSYDINKANLNQVDRYIIDRFNKALKEIQMNMDKYEYANVGSALTHFIWDDFANWYIELSKTGLQSDDPSAVYATKATLQYILKNITILISPFMPFVSEEIYLTLPNALESINLESWPAVMDIETSDLDEVSFLLNAITQVRESRVSYEVKPSKPLSIQILDDHNNAYDLNQGLKDMLSSMAKVSFKDTLSDALVLPIAKGAVVLDQEELVDKEALREKLEVEKVRLESEIKRGTNMLSNTNFISKAPQAKVDEEKRKLEEYKR